MKLKNKKQSEIYYLIGIPASGKSTYAEKLSKKKDLPILSSDELRKELTGNAADVETIPHLLIFKVLRERAEALIQNGKDFIWDATNIQPQYRQEEINKWKETGARIHGVLFTTAKEKALERNAKRPRVVPQEVIERMHDDLIQTPLNTELDLFDAITMVAENGQELQVYDRELATKHKFEAEISPRQFKTRLK